MRKKFVIKFKKKVIWRFRSLFHLFQIYKLFTLCNELNYSLVKKDPNFPFIKFGSDFDIYVENIEMFNNKIVKFFKNKKKYKTTTNTIEDGNLQTDLFYNDKFIYKFDLYNNCFISDQHNKIFITDVINKSQMFKFYFFKEFEIKVPNSKMDTIVRIFEIKKHPSKQHHLTLLKNTSKNLIKDIKIEINIYSDKSFDKIFNLIDQK